MADVSKLEIPKIITKDLEEMANKIEISAKLLSDAVSGLQSDIETTIKKAKKIEIIREQVRESEFAVLKKLFANQQTVKAVILKDVITLTGGVADKVEEAGDRLISLALKYKS
jgi:uncharacterized protein Yka (UPF0111/DUF47 family)